MQAKKEKERDETQEVKEKGEDIINGRIHFDIPYKRLFNL